jgi:hypothetical protein
VPAPKSAKKIAVAGKKKHLGIALLLTGEVEVDAVWVGLHGRRVRVEALLAVIPALFALENVGGKHYEEKREGLAGDPDQAAAPAPSP